MVWCATPTPVGGIKNLPTDRVDLDDGLFEVILVRKPMNIFDIGAGLQALLRPGAVEESGALLSFHAAVSVSSVRSPSLGPSTGSTAAAMRSMRSGTIARPCRSSPGRTHPNRQAGTAAEWECSAAVFL